MTTTEIDVLVQAGLSREHAAQIVALATMAQALAEIRRHAESQPLMPTPEGGDEP